MRVDDAEAMRGTEPARGFETGRASQRHPRMAGHPGEARAGGDQHGADAEAPREGFDIQEAETASPRALPGQDRRAGDGAVKLRQPAPFPAGLDIADEPHGHCRRARLDLRSRADHVPADLRVPRGDHGHVAAVERAQGDAAGGGVSHQQARSSWMARRASNSIRPLPRSTDN